MCSRLKARRLKATEKYANLWTTTIKNVKTWHRCTKQKRHPDRLWIHKHVKEPVLDVGCGTCLDAKTFDKYVGVDVTRIFLKSAHSLYGVSHIIRCDARFLPFKDKTFETAYSKGLLLHYLQEEGMKIISEMLRVSNVTVIAWGIIKWAKKQILPARRVHNYLPSNDPFVSACLEGFYYNRYDLAELQKRFEVTFIGKGTSITIIEEKK